MSNHYEFQGITIVFSETVPEDIVEDVDGVKTRKMGCYRIGDTIYANPMHRPGFDKAVARATQNGWRRDRNSAVEQFAAAGFKIMGVVTP